MRVLVCTLFCSLLCFLIVIATDPVQAHASRTQPESFSEAMRNFGPALLPSDKAIRQLDSVSDADLHSAIAGLDLLLLNTEFLLKADCQDLLMIPRGAQGLTGVELAKYLSDYHEYLTRFRDATIELKTALTNRDYAQWPVFRAKVGDIAAEAHGKL